MIFRVLYSGTKVNKATTNNLIYICGSTFYQRGLQVSPKDPVQTRAHEVKSLYWGVCADLNAQESHRQSWLGYGSQ